MLFSFKNHSTSPTKWVSPVQHLLHVVMNERKGALQAFFEVVQVLFQVGAGCDYFQVEVRYFCFLGID